jgi:hypothetical protein
MGTLVHPQNPKELTSLKHQTPQKVGVIIKSKKIN